jgi:hypothetical protein
MTPSPQPAAPRVAWWAGLNINGPAFKNGETYLSKDGDNPEAPWPGYGWPLGTECWYYRIEGLGSRKYATGLTPVSALARATEVASMMRELAARRSDDD